VTLTAANPFWLYVSANWSGSIKKDEYTQLYFEGTLNENYDIAQGRSFLSMNRYLLNVSDPF